MVVFAALLLTILAWGALLFFISPDEIVERIGITNGYLILFFIALFGGVTSLTSGSYFATVITLALGGLNPLILALVSASAATIGDTVFFYLGHHGHAALTQGRVQSFVERLTHALERRPWWHTSVGVYVLAAVTPVPNELIATSLGLAQRSFFTVVPPLALGNMTLAYLIATLSVAATSL
jgi:membrane protein YqaA with SNARE-associated domain